MKKDYYNVIGIMSGTSLDGVDLAHIGIQENLIFACALSFEITRKKTYEQAKMDHSSGIIYKF